MKVAVVGIRGMGQTHIAAIKKMDFVSEVAGVDVTAEVRESVGRAQGVQTFADLESACRTFKPDAVIVATPPSRHREVIEQCLERRIPVLTEKPICSTLDDSRAMVQLAAKLGVPFQAGFELRYCGSTRAFRSVLDAGALGKLSQISLIQISGSKTQPGYMSRARTGGIFYEKLCHQVDLFRYYFGEPKRVMAIAAPHALKHYEIEENVMSVTEFPNGEQGTITFQTRRAAQVNGLEKPPREFDGREAGHFYEMTYIGDKGSATFDAWTECIDVIRYNHREDLKSELVRRIDVRKEFGEPSYDVFSQDGDFLERARNGQPPQFPASDALQSMIWCEKAEESLRRKGDWISA
ncbi:MAG TPA: Gfo/Idh/MocA family oxidoreductase [Planctomycetota bacterium]|nr:Gfo/Idh/MocA family oxidoreductase [Planctomycetota bacterium]